jgi:hypothetical protein
VLVLADPNSTGQLQTGGRCDRGEQVAKPYQQRFVFAAWRRDHVQHTLPDLVAAIEVELCAFLEEPLDRGRLRVEHQRRHGKTGYAAGGRSATRAVQA